MCWELPINLFTRLVSTHAITVADTAAGGVHGFWGLRFIQSAPPFA